MAGIYLHIPFCKSRCKYCDFYSTTLFSSHWQNYKMALLHELEMRKDLFLQDLQVANQSVDTLYLGGGTPSLLSKADFAEIISAIRSTIPGRYLEITIEANPGDLDLNKLTALRNVGVNRLSIGIQSFNDTLLHSVGRRHNAQQAKEAVQCAQQAGFDNISIDLMYGLPNETMQDWAQDVETACFLNIQHISAYCLTYEEGTPLYQALIKGEVTELDDDLLNQMQDLATQKFAQQGFSHYEVSNYALPDRESKHNSAYWRHKPYLGLGAGAHSFDGRNRRLWNPDNMDQYIKGVELAWREQNLLHLPLDGETLSEDDIYNETVMLGLRTSEGVDIGNISNKYIKHFFTSVEPFVSQGLVLKNDNHYCPAEKGFHVLNRIIEAIMV